LIEVYSALWFQHPCPCPCLRLCLCPCPCPCHLLMPEPAPVPVPVPPWEILFPGVCQYVGCEMYVSVSCSCGGQIHEFVYYNRELACRVDQYLHNLISVRWVVA